MNDQPFDQTIDPERPGFLKADMLGLRTTDGGTNIYAIEAEHTRQYLWNRDSRPVLDQAIAWATYGDSQSAANAIRDFYESFKRRYGLPARYLEAPL